MRSHLMLSDDAVEDGACLARSSSIYSGLEDIQIKLIWEHARRFEIFVFELIG